MSTAKSKNTSTANGSKLRQVISDVEGLERLQVMQLKLIREINKQLAELKKS